jgi:glucose-1-phosphatase
VKNGNRIRLVCFDLGGVLVRICHGWREACAAAGLDVRSRAGLDIDGVWRPVAHEHEIGRLTKTGWAETLSTALAGLYTTDELCRIHDAYIASEYDAVSGIVDRIHRSGIATACLSNTNDDHWSRMLRRGGPAGAASPDFPAVRRLRQRFASHLLGMAKPDEAIYRTVQSATGRRGEEILFFDDTAANVAAARRLEWNAEIIDPRIETAPQIAAHLERHAVVSRIDR